MPRGRFRKNPYLERELLSVLRDSKKGVGFRELFSRLKVGSKSTLSSTLKLLQSQNKITKNRDGKYVPSLTILLLSNIEGLKLLLDNLDRVIPNLTSEERAYIGIRLWTVIFQNEFHPATMFMDDSPYFRISNSVTKSIHMKAVQEFFESRNQPSMFELEMYQLFFSFCVKFSSMVLDSVFRKILNVGYEFLPTHTKINSLAKLFHKEIWIINNLHTRYYGIPFFQIILETKPSACNKNTLKHLKERNMFQKIM